MSDRVIERIDANLDESINELFEFLRIPSVSARSEHSDDVRAAAVWVRDAAEKAGLENCQVLETAGHPVVYADWTHAHNAPTVLIYGHYDVQPPEPLDLWTSPPFEPEVRDGNIFARGSVDDKGQVHLHLKGIEATMREEGKLPVNVKLIIEGEEEIGSPSLAPFIQEYADLLACDAVVVSDTPMYDYDMPSITYGLRGMAYFQISVKGADTDLHSGMFGGAVANPINVLCQLIAGMKDAENRITLPGFYHDVLPVTDSERASLGRLPYSETDFEEMIGITDTVGEAGYTDLERLWARPTLDVCGIWGGYQGEGAKTVLPALAQAKVSMRLVANQDPATVGEQLARYLEEAAPAGVTVTLEDLHGGNPALTPTDTPVVRAGLQALRVAFGSEPYLIRNGGSIPIVTDFERLLEAPVLLMGFGLPDQNAHAPDEKMNVANYHRGIRSSALFLREFAAVFEEEEAS